MARVKKWALISLFLMTCFLNGCSYLNRFQEDGEITLPGLKDKVTVLRDEKGMAYIYAQNLDDALLAQGFITAQDRLFQMELIRLFSSGRLCELAGNEARALDVRMRTIGFLRNAERHARILDAPTRRNFQRYIDGVNIFIRERTKEIPLEFKLSGIKPQPWRIEDALAIMYYMSWGSSANLQTEIVAQMLVEKLGFQKAREIFPININPDDKIITARKIHRWEPKQFGLNPGLGRSLLAYLEPGPLRIGSNNWIVGPKSSAGGKPILANDPHLDTRILPGPWYPCGIITPEMRFVGVGIAGTPSQVIGRNEHIAVGVTNSYGDMQDLYIETVDPKDPKRYLEGKASLPFKMIEETLKIKDKQAPGGFRTEPISIKTTRRGPVITQVLPGLKTDKVISLRWAPFETMGPSLGLDKVQRARSVHEVREALKEVNWIGLNFVFGDTNGNIGFLASGKLPIRSQGEGTLPYVVRSSRDNWTGWIPFEKMPQSINPEKGWLGTCNHKTVPASYPYYYSSHLSPSYRYRRLENLLDKPGIKSAEMHWRFQRDTLNLEAVTITPYMIKALNAHEDTRALAGILGRWNFQDDPESAAPTVFQAVYRQFAYLVFGDELGPELTAVMLDDWYFWQERLQNMILQGTSPWFDNIKTAQVKETRDDLFHQAALLTIKELTPLLGRDPQKWVWGKVHQLDFVNPIRRKGFGKGVLGGGSYPMGGSGETLYRAIYDFGQPFGVTISASLRMVVDLADPDRIIAVLPGGVTARTFDPHFKDQIKPFMNGEKRYWWFSDQAIKKQARHTLVLNP
jgi:penicillin G amidase